MAINMSSVRTGVRVKPPKVVLYGVGGIGKTTWAAGSYKPIFIFTEEGQGLLDVPRFEPREGNPVVQSWQEIIDCLNALYTQDHDHNTVVIDTLDFAEHLLWKHTAAKYNKEDVESFGYGKGYTYAVDEARMLFQGLDALRNDRGMAIVLLCHSETKRFESPDAESYDRYQLRLQSRLAAYVHDWCDALLFANFKTHVVKDKEEFNKERRRAVGQGERIIYTEERPAHWAKNRYGLPLELPMNWASFQSSIVAPQASQPEPKPEPKPQPTEEAAAEAQE